MEGIDERIKAKEKKIKNVREWPHGHSGLSSVTYYLRTAYK